MEKKTLVVNFFAGPGAGKSTLTAATFAMLKWRGINCEMSLEYAKDKVWEESLKVLENQFYLFGKQSFRLHRLDGKVDVVITDAPILNSIIYDARGNDDFVKLIRQEHQKYENLNFFVVRQKKYMQEGRLQTEDEAKELDNRIVDMLTKETETMKERIFPIHGSPESLQYIEEVIVNRLKRKGVAVPDREEHLGHDLKIDVESNQ